MSEAWLRDWFRSADAPDYETAMEIFGEILDGTTENRTRDSDGSSGGWEFYDYGDGDSYIITFGSDAHASIPPELWWHVANVLGREVPEKFRASGFSCSC